MATYLELRSLLRGETELTQKVEAAVIIAADAINQEAATTPNHANRLIWAQQVFQSWATKAREMLPALIAADKSASLVGIKNASDATIQSYIDAVIDVFATG